MKTYALEWIDSTDKSFTCIDRVDGENPMWNEKFLFRVSPDSGPSTLRSILGVHNVGTSVLLGSDVPATYVFSSVNYRDLIKEDPKSKIMKRSHSTLGIPNENPYLHYDGQPYSREPIKERHRMIREMDKTKHARSSSDGAIAGWGSGHGFSSKNAARSGPLDKFSYKKPVSVSSSLAP
ncbi:hypothetical protein F3Y22_tig00110151pilonHSYRG00288 [Hibiscus syriacus]|uniref:C2 domain-containing protein n=1 Tax=Hibiscus syriacus TaxID=106335 RepID=A0A6A3BI56_HIBSY|nr:hypothetical protein F3Y22_tig00110151pilonHSYRG00288 [Hibiscus syriacus]